MSGRKLSDKENRQRISIIEEMLKDAKADKITGMCLAYSINADQNGDDATQVRGITFGGAIEILQCQGAIREKVDEVVRESPILRELAETLAENKKH